jgi:hypothetical protein
VWAGAHILATRDEHGRCNPTHAAVKSQDPSLSIVFWFPQLGKEDMTQEQLDRFLVEIDDWLRSESKEGGLFDPKKLILELVELCRKDETFLEAVEVKKALGLRSSTELEMVELNVLLNEPSFGIDQIRNEDLFPLSLSLTTTNLSLRLEIAANTIW